MKKKDNEVKWVWLVVTLAFLTIIVIAVMVEPVTTSQQNKLGFEKPVNNNNGNFGFDSKRKLRNNRNSSNRYNRNNSNNGWNTSKKRKVAEGVGVVAVVIFFAVIAILWMLIYSLRKEFDYKPKKKAKENTNSGIKTILWVQLFGLLMCMCLTAYEPHFAWGIVALIVLLLITACYWAEQDTCIPYGTQISLNKKPINVGKQKYRIQIFLSGSWDDTAWGGNDKNAAISRAKDISENNSWDISKVRVRKGSWHGEIIKEFSRSSFKKLIPPIKKKPPIKNPPVVVKKKCLQKGKTTIISA